MASDGTVVFPRARQREQGRSQQHQDRMFVRGGEGTGVGPANAAGGIGAALKLSILCVRDLDGFGCSRLRLISGGGGGRASFAKLALDSEQTATFAVLRAKWYRRSEGNE